MIFLYYDESLVSSNLNSNLLRFHCAHPNIYPNHIIFLGNDESFEINHDLLTSDDHTQTSSNNMVSKPTEAFYDEPEEIVKPSEAFQDSGDEVTSLTDLDKVDNPVLHKVGECLAST